MGEQGLSCGAPAKPGSKSAYPQAAGHAPRRGPGVRRSPAPRRITHQEGVRRRAAHGPPRQAPHLPSTHPGLLLSPCHQRRRVPGRGGGRRCRLCCGPASLRLQHKTRGVGAAPGSRVVARGLTPCCDEPGLWAPAPFPLLGGPPGFDSANPTCCAPGRASWKTEVGIGSGRWDRDRGCTHGSRGKAMASVWGGLERAARSPGRGSVGAARSR